MKLSKNAANCALFFLCGELPIEGKLHRDVFSLFYSIWVNSETKIHQVVKYLMKNSCENSRTWSVFVKQLSEKYNLDDPIECLDKGPPSKSQYKEYILTKITAFHEKQLRVQSGSNSCMQYLNVSVSGLRGQRHPAISGLFTTEEVKQSRCHIKMLCGDYFTHMKKSIQSGGSPHCMVCEDKSLDEDILHILTQCSAYSDIRERKLQDMTTLCQAAGKINLHEIIANKNELCQFWLDPTSINLKFRISPVDPQLNQYLVISRSLCNSINTRRLKILDSHQKNHIQKK